jgi:hypothetical protein
MQRCPSPSHLRSRQDTPLAPKMQGCSFQEQRQGTVGTTAVQPATAATCPDEYRRHLRANIAVPLNQQRLNHHQLSHKQIIDMQRMGAHRTHGTVASRQTNTANSKSLSRSGSVLYTPTKYFLRTARKDQNPNLTEESMQRTLRTQTTFLHFTPSSVRKRGVSMQNTTTVARGSLAGAEDYSADPHFPNMQRQRLPQAQSYMVQHAFPPIS